MKNFPKSALILLAIIFFSLGCSKDKSMERQIEKNDGVWNIDLVTYSFVQQYVSTSASNTVIMDSEMNVGTFTFEKGGTGNFNYTLKDTIVRSGSFTWTVEDEKASLISVAQSINIFNPSAGIIQKVIAYTGTKQSKTKITLEGSETFQYINMSGTTGVSQNSTTATFTLSRK